MKILLAVKVGDQETTKGKTRIHGEVICELPMSEPLSKHQRKVYAHVAVDKQEWEAKKEDVLRQNGEEDLYRTPAQIIDFKKIENAIERDNYENDLKSKKIVNLVDLSAQKIENILSSPKKNDVPDNNSVASGTYTVGTGGDYARLSLAAADIAATLTGDLTFTLISDCSETAQTVIAPNLDSNTLKIEGPKTCGNCINEYCKIINYSSATHLVNYSAEGPGTFLMQRLYFRADYDFGANQAFFNQTGINTSNNIILKDLIMSGNTNTALGCIFNDKDSVVKLINCIFYDLTYALFIVNLGGDTLDITIENCAWIANNGAIQFNNPTAQTTIQNCIFNANTLQPENTTNTVSYNCATDQASVGCATNNDPINNVIASEVYKSVLPDSPDFLKLKNEAGNYRRRTNELISGGKAPELAENTNGFYGNPRPHRGGNYSIGPMEYLRKLGTYFNVKRNIVK